MNKRYYYLSNGEYNLLSLFDLTRFVELVPSDPFNGCYESVISYYSIDDLARVVYERRYRGANYDKLICLVKRLQDVLEVNDHS